MTAIQLEALDTAQRLTTELRHNVARLLTLGGHDADLAAIAMRGAEMSSDALLKLARPTEVDDLDGAEKVQDTKYVIHGNVTVLPSIESLTIHNE